MELALPNWGGDFMLKFSYNLPVRIDFGAGRAGTAGEYIASFKPQRVLFVTDVGLGGTPAVRDIVTHLRESGLNLEVNTGATANPTAQDVDREAAMVRQGKYDLLIAVGGGSVIDFAKGLAITAPNQKNCWDYVGTTNRKPCAPAHPGLPLIAMPTTAGTGSEVTPYAVFVNGETHEKAAIAHPFIFPAAAIVDPLLMLSMPPQLTALTGIDALSHAIEAYISINAQPFSDLAALESIRLIGKYLPVAWANGDDLEARGWMAWASTLAGMAIAHVGTTLPHAMGQPLSGLFNMHHGASIALCLPEIMEFSLSSNPPKFAAIAEAMEPAVRSMPLRVKAEESVRLVTRLLRDMDADVTMGTYGITAEDIEHITDVLLASVKGDADVHPRKVTREEIIEIYHRCL